MSKFTLDQLGPSAETAGGSKLRRSNGITLLRCISRIRSVIQKPDEALYILHTSIGAITVHKFVYRGEAGYVFLQGVDEQGRDRIAGFSEQQLSTFAFEIRMKSADKNGQIRFNQNLVENLF